MKKFKFAQFKNSPFPKRVSESSYLWIYSFRKWILYPKSTIEMGYPWESKTYLMNRRYVFKEFQIFPKRYCGTFWVEGLQSCKISKLEIWKKSAARPNMHCMQAAPVRYPNDGIIFKRSQLCSPLTNSTSLERTKTQ